MAKQEIFYRNAFPRDVESIIQVLKATGLFFEPIDDHPEWYEEKCNRDPGSIIVATDDNDVVGMVMFTFDPILSVIAHLGVLPTLERRGIGKTLLQMALKRIKDKGGHYVAGYVVSTNAASLDLCKREGLEAYEHPCTAVYRTFE